MDVVHRLIRQVVRGFYDTRSVLVVDAILVHHVLSDRELASLMGMPTKDLRSTCARLKDDHLIKEISHKDDASREHRIYVQTMYYIHFTEAVDAIKWKMHCIESKLKEEMDAQHNPQDYVCDRCQTRYKTLDALTNFDPETGTFLCDVCGSHLREDDGPTAEEGRAQDKMEELMNQLKPLITALKQIDDLSIPENTFESEQMVAVPLPSPENTPEPGLKGASDPRAGMGLTIAGSSDSKLPQAVQSTFQVHITSEAEQAAVAAENLSEKKRLAEENALPEWHVKSTVGAQPASLPSIKSEPAATELQVSTEESQAKLVEDDAMDAYYKKLELEQLEQAKNGTDKKEDEDEEEEDDFEDIDV